MYAVVGTLILASTVTLTAWAYVQYRRPNPRAWTRWEMSAQMVSLLIAAGVAFGLGALGRFAADFEAQRFGGAELAAVLAAVAAAYLAVRAARARWRRLLTPAAPVAASATAGLAAGPTPVRLGEPANDSGPPKPPIARVLGRAKRRPRRRAA